MKKFLFAGFLGLAACTQPTTKIYFHLDEEGVYAVKSRESDGSFSTLDTLEILGEDAFEVSFDTTRMISFLPVEGELPVVHAVVGNTEEELHISSDGLVSGNPENNWLGEQRRMQIALIRFIDSLDVIKASYEDSSTFAGLPLLDSAFFQYAEAYRAKILDHLGNEPGQLSNLLTLYHRIGIEPVVAYQEDSTLLLAVLKSVKSNYPYNPDVAAFESQIQAYRKAQHFTNTVLAAADKFQPGAWFPALELEDAQRKLVSFPAKSIEDAVVVVWASWCVPCRNELRALSSQGVDQSNFIYLSLDGLEQQRNPYADWMEAIQSDGLQGVQVTDFGGQRSKIITTLGVQDLPLYFRVQNGRITQRTQSIQAILGLP